MNQNKEDIYLEPVDAEHVLSDSLLRNGNQIQVSGRFYTWKGFPRNYYSELIPSKARVLQIHTVKFVEKK